MCLNISHTFLIYFAGGAVPAFTYFPEAVLYGHEDKGKIIVVIIITNVVLLIGS